MGKWSKGDGETMQSPCVYPYLAKNVVTSLIDAVNIFMKNIFVSTYIKHSTVTETYRKSNLDPINIELKFMVIFQSHTRFSLVKAFTKNCKCPKVST